MQKKKRTTFVILSLVCSIYAHSFERNMCTYIARLLKRNKAFQRMQTNPSSIKNILTYAHRNNTSRTINQNTGLYAVKENIIGIFNRIKSSYNQQQTILLQAYKKYAQQLKNAPISINKKQVGTALALTSGLITLEKQKSRVVYAEEISNISFKLKKSYFTNPKNLRKKLAQYNKEAHPELAQQIILSINSYLNWQWQWVLEKAIKQAPKSVNILIEFLAPHMEHLAEHSQECAGVIAFVHQENPNMLKPIKSVIQKDKKAFEQTKYGKEILKAIKL